MPIPIIFIHRNIHNGNNSYLNYSLSQAHLLNPQSPIYLITDDVRKGNSFVNYVQLKEYDEEAKKFAEKYKHMSTNNFEHELFCFQRWFIIKKFLEKSEINDFLYLDSDVLLFCDIEKEFKKLQGIYDFTICNKIGPQFTYFTDKKYLLKFCDFLNQLYTNPEYYKRLEEKHQKHLDNNLPGGVCDMTAFWEYQHHQLGNVKDLSIIENDTVFDDNINCSDGFEMSKLGMKNMKLKDDHVFCKQIDSNKMIQFNALHFQGSAKKYMYKFYRGKNLLIQRLVDYLKDMRSRN